MEQNGGGKVTGRGRSAGSSLARKGGQKGKKKRKDGVVENARTPYMAIRGAELFRKPGKPPIPATKTGGKRCRAVKVGSAV